MPDALVRIVLQGDEAVAGADRVSQALGRLERGEATRALRGTRVAIDELANAATGLHPALGRLVSTLAQFGIGGVTGLAAVGGLAAIGLEIKSLLDIVPNLEKAFGKLNDEFAHMGGPGAAGFAQLHGLREQLEGQAKPGIWEQLLDVRGPLGDVSEALKTGRETKSAAIQNEIDRQRAEITKIEAKATEELEKKQRAATLAIGEHVLALDKLRLGTTPTHLALTNLATQSALLKNALSDLDPLTKARINNLIGEAAAIERVNAATKDRQERDDRRRAAEAAFPTEAVLGDVYARARLGRSQPGFGVVEDLSNTMNAPGIAALRSYDPGAPGGGKGKQPGINWAGVFGASLGALGQAKQADIGGTISGLGGVAAAIPGGQIPGAVLGGLGGLVSLFSSHKPKVVISAFEGQARDDIQKIRGDPATTQVIILGGAGQGMAYDLARLAARGITPRFPGSR